MRISALTVKKTNKPTPHTKRAGTKVESDIRIEAFNFALCNISAEMINTAQDQG